MYLHLFGVWLHIVVGIVLAGYALFWLVMAYALQRGGGELQTAPTLSMIGRAGWPPFIAPPAVRIPLLGLGWLLLAFMIVSGVMLLHGRFDWVITAKVVLVVLFALAHGWFTLRPSPRAALMSALLVAGVICVSAFLR